jgi:tripartite-type tricarboxylate transporter receptor subunit TctC
MAADQVYSVVMNDQTIVADATLVIVHTASAMSSRASMVEIIRASCSQRGTDTSDQLGILIAQKASAFGTYTSTTPAPYRLGVAVSGIVGGTAGAAGTAGTDASAEGAGTVTPIVTRSFNNLNGFEWVPTLEERITLTPDTAIILKLVGTPATLTNWYAELVYRELT